MQPAGHQTTHTVDEFAALLRLPADLSDVVKGKRVRGRLMAIECGTVCGRCGGTGRHSFNGSHSICYKCGGAGRNIAALSDSIWVDAVNAVEFGRLDLYLQLLKRRREIRPISREIVWAQCSDGGHNGMGGFGLRFRYVNGSIDPTDVAWLVWQEARNALGPVFKELLGLDGKLGGRVLLAEEKVLIPKFLDLFAQWNGLRQKWAAELSRTHGFTDAGRFCWRSNRVDFMRIVAGDPFALTNGMAAWEADGQPESVPDSGADASATAILAS